MTNDRQLYVNAGMTEVNLCGVLYRASRNAGSLHLCGPRVYDIPLSANISSTQDVETCFRSLSTF